MATKRKSNKKRGRIYSNQGGLQIYPINEARDLIIKGYQHDMYYNESLPLEIIILIIKYIDHLWASIEFDTATGRKSDIRRNYY